MRTKFATMILPLALCMALVVGVQAKDKSQKHKGSSTSVIGCVQPGSSPNTYVLSNIASDQHSQSSMSGQSSQSGQSQTPSEMARTEGTSYVLIPQGKVDLQKWVGQRVKVTGRMATSTSSSAGSTTGTNQPSGDTSMSSSSMSGSSELLVTSVHKASGTCQ